MRVPTGAKTTGAGADLWLLDCTYWSNIAGFVGFCRDWHRAGRLKANMLGAARFICIYRGQTQTEAIADTLRAEVAGILGVAPVALLRHHHAGHSTDALGRTLKTDGALFLRTDVPHNDIPAFFLPLLIESAAF